MAIPKEKFINSLKKDTYVYLNKKELSHYLNIINERFDFNYDFYSNHAFIRSSDKIWITSPDVLKHDYTNIKIEGIGMVFARIIKENDIKLTTNAVQVFGKFAQKNVFDITEEECERYIRGLNLNKYLPTDEGYVILKRENDYIGLGKYMPKFSIIKNLIPKARRIKRL